MRRRRRMIVVWKTGRGFDMFWSSNWGKTWTTHWFCKVFCIPQRFSTSIDVNVLFGGWDFQPNIMETVETTMIENMRKLDQSVPPNKKLGFQMQTNQALWHWATRNWGYRIVWQLCWGKVPDSWHSKNQGFYCIWEFSKTGGREKNRNCTIFQHI